MRVAGCGGVGSVTARPHTGSPILLFLIRLILASGLPSAAPSADYPTIDERLMQRPAHDLTVEVFDPDGHPVPQAEVFVYYARDWDGVRDRLAGTRFTDDTGAAVFSECLRWEPVFELPSDGCSYPPPPQGRQACHVFARHTQHGMGAATLLEDQPFRVRIVLEAAVSREISVVDQDNAPIQGAKVYLRSTKTGGSGIALLEEDIGFCSAVTDADGIAVLLAPGSAVFWAVKEGFVRGSTQREAVLQPAMPVMGRVTFEDGTPARHAGVWLELEHMNTVWRAGTTTDEDGRYALPFAPAATYAGKTTSSGKRSPGTLMLHARDLRIGSPYQTCMLTLYSGAGGPREVDLELRRPPRMAGRVIDIDTRKGLQGVVLQFTFHTPGRAGQGTWVVTEEGGDFETHVPPGSGIHVMVMRNSEDESIVDEEWRLQNTPLFVTDRVERDLTDLRWAVKALWTNRLRGKVVDSSGNPLPAAQVYGPGGSLTKTDKDGCFTLKSGLKEREWELFIIGNVARDSGDMDEGEATDSSPSASAPNGGQAEACYALVEAGDRRVELQTQGVRDRRGKILDTSRAPAAGLNVSIAPYINGARIQSLSREAVVGADGYFTLEGACRGAKYSVYAHGPEEAGYRYEQWIREFPSEYVRGPLVLFVHRYCLTLKGRVQDKDDQPVKGAKICLTTSRVHETAESYTHFDANEEGEFAIPGVRYGEVTLLVSAEGYHNKRFTTFADAKPKTVALRKAEDPVVARITVADDMNQPLGNVPIDIFASPDMELAYIYSGYTNSSGEMFVPWTQFTNEEEYAVVACRLKGATFGFVRLVPDEDANLLLRVCQHVPRWRGRLVDSQHVPVAGASLRVDSVAQDGQERCAIGLAADREYIYTTDENGAFDLTDFSRHDTVILSVSVQGCEAGEARLFADDRMGIWHQPVGDQLPVKINRLNEDPAGEAVITLPVSVRIRGCLTLKETGEPLEGVTVYLDRLLQKDLWTDTDARGRFKFEGLLPGKCTLSIPGKDPEGNPNPYILEDPVEIDVQEQTDIQVNVEAHKLIYVRGKIVDAKTGGPPPHRVVVIINTGGEMPYGVEIEKDGTWTLPGYAGVFDIAVTPLFGEHEYARFQNITLPLATEEPLLFEVDFPEK